MVAYYALKITIIIASPMALFLYVNLYQLQHYLINGSSVYHQSKAVEKVLEAVETKLLIDYFTVASLVICPLNGSEAGVDLVLIRTCLLLLCKSNYSYAN